MNRNILVDANNLFHRAYAIYVKDKTGADILTNISGYPTGMIYGTYSMLQNWLDDINHPTRLIFFMDGVPRRRLDIDPSYKQRDEKSVSPGTNDASIRLSDGFHAKNEIAVIFRIAHHLGIDIYYGREEEADDLIASFVKENSKDVNIVISSDKDFYQLLQKYNTMALYRPGVKGNRMFDADRATEHMKELYDVHIEPKDILMFKALTGDPSDGIRGVPRLRKKIIAPLCKYESVEELMATGLPGFSKKEKENTLAMQGRIATNLKLVKLNEDLDVENFKVQSVQNMDIAIKILEDDLDIRAISVNSFRTTPKMALRSGNIVPVEDWLSDI